MSNSWKLLPVSFEIFLSPGESIEESIQRLSDEAVEQFKRHLSGLTPEYVASQRLVFKHKLTLSLESQGDPQ